MAFPRPTFTSYFNSRPSARGDDFTETAAMMDKISIHAPPRGATLTSANVIPADANFNSRPSARGDADVKKEIKALTISIHAPPRGATRVALSSASSGGISIHAPPRGATVSTAM